MATELLFEFVSMLSIRRIEGDVSADALCFLKIKAGVDHITEELG